MDSLKRKRRQSAVAEKQYSTWHDKYAKIDRFFLICSPGSNTFYVVVKAIFHLPLCKNAFTSLQCIFWRANIANYNRGISSSKLHCGKQDVAQLLSFMLSLLITVCQRLWPAMDLVLYYLLPHVQCVTGIWTSLAWLWCLVLGWRQFQLLTELPVVLLLILKVVKSDTKKYSSCYL